MGISGLLPMLKPIQVNKHLSDLSGQTLGVDAYVWLHRGTYGCATEIATGKQTTKYSMRVVNILDILISSASHRYVDFAMQRIRLLRHHNIEPYLVFDGGPLPAKKGTESDRHIRRAENLSRGKAFTTRGQHTQARECYVKAIDVTPAMAYQLIKALKAESVSYVVAPYEADAQLAYLERTGLINGIITEDSDLLVFGCKRVYYKLDVVSGTLVSISRDQFTSIDGSPQCNGISLVAWSDAQFRAMAILSGCDYLPSIPGIGLKTAWSALKKYKSVENVVRSIKLEGKKTVPHDYLAKYKMAEMCFLHQRIYDPRTEQLIHLTPLQQALDKETDAYVGRELSNEVAMGIAVGDIDPVTLAPILDICPSYQPRGTKVRPLSFASANKKGKEKAQTEPNTKGLLHFFGRQQPSITPSRNQTALAGQDSGKRKLTEACTRDPPGNKRRKSDETPSRLHSSRYFSSPTTRKKHQPQDDEVILVSSDTEKENHFQRTNDSDTSVVAAVASESLLEWQDDAEDGVTQEDGYLSTDSWDAPLLSSPSRKPRRACDLSDTDHVSSPPHNSKFKSRTEFSTSQCVLSPMGSSLRAAIYEDDIDEIETDRIPASSARVELVDLADLLGEDTGSGDLSQTPVTPGISPHVAIDLSDLDDLEDEEPSIEERQRAVGKGWRERWACNTLPLKRTAASYVTPRARESINRIKIEGRVSAPSSIRSRSGPPTNLDSPWSRPLAHRTVKTTLTR
jgi:exonuclease-1